MCFIACMFFGFHDPLRTILEFPFWSFLNPVWNEESCSKRTLIKHDQSTDKLATQTLCLHRGGHSNSSPHLTWPKSLTWNSQNWERPKLEFSFLELWIILKFTSRPRQVKTKVWTHLGLDLLDTFNPRKFKTQIGGCTVVRNSRDILSHILCRFSVHKNDGKNTDIVTPTCNFECIWDSGLAALHICESNENHEEHWHHGAWAGTETTNAMWNYESASIMVSSLVWTWRYPNQPKSQKLGQ